MNRTLVHGAFVLDEAGKSILLHDTLALAHVDVNEVQGTIDAFSLALAEHGGTDRVQPARRGVMNTTQEDGHPEAHLRATSSTLGGSQSKLSHLPATGVRLHDLRPPMPHKP